MLLRVLAAVLLCWSVAVSQADADDLPPGGEIVFASNRDGNFEIYSGRADGSKPANLTKHKALDHNPSWSPDGKRLAFSSNREVNDDIFVMKSDGLGMASRVRRAASFP